MKRKLIQCVILIAAFSAVVVSITPQAGICWVDTGTNQQTIDGFGFSSAWCGTLSTAKNDALYNTLGMSLLRVRIDPFNAWSSEIANASAAHARGAKVLGSPWSPPPSMKDNTNVVQGRLLPQNYGAYASYLNQAANAHGLDYVSLQNEPDWNPDYEGCVWTPAELQTFCATNARNDVQPAG